MGKCFSCDVKNETPATTALVTTKKAWITHEEPLCIQIYRQVSRKKSHSAPPSDERNSVVLSHNSICISPPARGRSSRLEDVITPKIIDELYHKHKKELV